MQSVLSIPEVTTFNDALRIYPTNAVKEYNYEHLNRLRRPCIQSKADNVGARAHKVKAADAGNLHNTPRVGSPTRLGQSTSAIPLMDGARIMLLENIWVDVGLVNGSLGTIVDFARRTNDNPRESPPFVVLIRFDKYVHWSGVLSRPT